MMRTRAIPWLLAGALTLPLSACGPGGGTRAPETPAAAVTKEQLYQQGHRLYQTGALDSARAVLERAAALDSSYAEPVADLAQLHYDLAMAERDEQAPLPEGRIPAIPSVLRAPGEAWQHGRRHL